MACPTILTGEQFLLRVLTHIDCQAQLIGSYGWEALGQPGSVASSVVVSLLTLFIAVFALRLMFGPAPSARDIFSDVLTIGIVLTLAFSWPAFRTLVHDPVLKGPGEIAAAMIPQSQNAGGSNFAQRLQAVDTDIVRLTAVGTGRQTGAYLDPQSPNGTFSGVGLQDEETFGSARLVWLGGIIGSLGLLRTAGAVLLALTPLAAGLLLFPATRGLFSGWLRGLALVMVGSLGVSLVLAVELAVLEPFLADALQLRALGYATPSVPTELHAIILGFALAQLGMIWLLSRVAFQRGWVSPPNFPDIGSRQDTGISQSERWSELRATVVTSRAQQVSDSVEQLIRREQRADVRRIPSPSVASAASGHAQAEAAGRANRVRLGSSYRRGTMRRWQAASKRDRSS